MGCSFRIPTEERDCTCIWSELGVSWLTSTGPRFTSSTRIQSSPPSLLYSPLPSSIFRLAVLKTLLPCKLSMGARHHLGRSGGRRLQRGEPECRTEQKGKGPELALVSSSLSSMLIIAPRLRFEGRVKRSLRPARRI